MWGVFVRVKSFRRKKISRLEIVQIASFYNITHGTICMIRFVWLLFGFKICSESEEIELVLSFKNWIIQILMENLVIISQFTHSDKSIHTSCIIPNSPCKTAFSFPKLFTFLFWLNPSGYRSWIMFDSFRL